MALAWEGGGIGSGPGAQDGLSPDR